MRISKGYHGYSERTNAKTKKNLKEFLSKSWKDSDEDSWKDSDENHENILKKN